MTENRTATRSFYETLDHLATALAASSKLYGETPEAIYKFTEYFCEASYLFEKGAENEALEAVKKARVFLKTDKGEAMKFKLRAVERSIVAAIVSTIYAKDFDDKVNAPWTL